MNTSAVRDFGIIAAMRKFGDKNKSGYKLSEAAIAQRRAAAKKFAHPAEQMNVDGELFRRLREAFPDPRKCRKFTDKVLAKALDNLHAAS